MHRKAASNAFRVNDIKHSLQVFSRVTDEVLQQLETVDGSEANLMTLLASVRIRGFLAVSFPTFHSRRLWLDLRNLQFRFDGLLCFVSDESVQLSMKFSSVSFEESEFGFHFNRLQALCFNRALNPLYRFLPFLPSEQKIRASKAFLDKVLERSLKAIQ